MSELVAAARRHVGLRFRHRGRKTEGPGKGVDCAGLVVCAYRDCGVELKDFELYEAEPAQHGPGLTERVREAMGPEVAVGPVSLDQLQLGDVLVIRFVREPHHVAIVGDYYKPGHFSIIHADAFPHDAIRGRVIEQRLAPATLALVTHVFRRPV